MSGRFSLILSAGCHHAAHTRYTASSRAAAPQHRRHCASTDQLFGQWRVSTPTEPAANPLSSPTVFNFFEPITPARRHCRAGLVSPAFSHFRDQHDHGGEYMRDGIYNGWPSASPNRDISLTLRRAGAGEQSIGDARPH